MKTDNKLKIVYQGVTYVLQADSMTINYTYPVGIYHAEMALSAAWTSININGHSLKEFVKPKKTAKKKKK